jgi:hypothetical protein
MSNHEHFQKLSALAAIGQLSCDEDRELNDHLMECAGCREVHDDYARVIQHQLPKADAIRWRIKLSIPTPAPSSEIRARFLARALAEGIDFSPEVEHLQGLRSSPSWWTLQWRLALAVAALAVVAISVTWLGQGYQLIPRSSMARVNAGSMQFAQEREVLHTQIATLRQSIEEKSAQFDRIKQANSISEESQQRLQKQLDEIRQQAEKLFVALQGTESEKTHLLNASQQKDVAIADLRAQNDKLFRERADILSSRTILEAQVRNLNESLQESTAKLEGERQLSAVSKDVRQLMGARNLHIMDVHDVGGGGKAAKAFGRVFYAGGQSLIFYAFDLPSGKLSPAKYTFQAWGQREAGPQAVRNLGTFEVDDHEQRRWVLKVNNPTLLADIDSVFVTAESLGDAKEPHGKRLMYAYIVGQPNHP